MSTGPGHLDNRNRVLLGWIQDGVTILATVLCVSLLTLGRAGAEEEPSLEQCDAECSLALARELAGVYEQNNPRAIDLLHKYFDAKINMLFESGELEQVVRLVQIVAPWAGKWAAGNQLSVDVSPALRHLAEWQNLEALARNELKPVQVVSARPI